MCVCILYIYVCICIYMTCTHRLNPSICIYRSIHPSAHLYGVLNPLSHLQPIEPPVSGMGENVSNSPRSHKQPGETLVNLCSLDPQRSPIWKEWHHKPLQHFGQGTPAHQASTLGHHLGPWPCLQGVEETFPYDGGQNCASW